MGNHVMSDMSRDTLHERRTTGEQPAESREIARSYWVVIPAYNEAETVCDVVKLPPDHTPAGTVQDFCIDTQRQAIHISGRE